MPKRCALGCDPNSEVKHGFPDFKRFPDRFKVWVQIVGGKLENESDYKKFQSSVICDKHFIDKFRNRNNRINAIAVPTLYLKGVKHGTLLDESIKSTTLNPLSTSNSSLAGVKHDNISNESYKSNTILDPVAISKTSLEGLSDNENPPQVTSEPIDSSFASDHCLSGLLKQETATQNSKPQDSLITKEPLVSGPACNYNFNSKKEHNYSLQDKQDTTKELKLHKPVVPPHIVQQLQTARKKIKQLQSEVSRLRKRNADTKKRLIDAKNNNKHSCLEKLTRNMTAAAKIFTHLQFSQTLKKNAGRRFTPEEQALSLSIFRSSPQCYNFLAKLFTLPSVKTLKKILRKQQVNVMPGLDSSGDPDITDGQPELYENNGETEVMIDPSEYYEDNEETVMMVDQLEHYENDGETVIMVDQSEFYENNEETVIAAHQHERYETSENDVIRFATTY